MKESICLPARRVWLKKTNLRIASISICAGKTDRMFYLPLLKTGDPFGKGRLKKRDPARPKRQGTSTAFEMPILGPETISTGAVPAFKRHSSELSDSPFSRCVIPSA